MGWLKTEKDNKSYRINLRCTLKEFYDIKKKALVYCDGNISEYVTYAARSYMPSKDELKKDPLDMSGPPRRKKKKRIKRPS